MAVYRFRVIFEGDEEIVRDIDIKPSQTLEDFHKGILNSIQLEDKYDASFFVSNDMWRQEEEIILNNDSDKSEEDDMSSKRLMKNCKLSSLIDDPHQKFIYMIDPNAPWTFFVELIKLVPDNQLKEYPECIKSVGESPKKNKTQVALEDFDDMEFDDDDDEIDDNDAYSSETNEEFDISEVDMDIKTENNE